MLRKIIPSLLLLASSAGIANEYSVSDIFERADRKYTIDYSTQIVIPETDMIVTPYVINGSNASIKDYPFYARLTIPLGSDSFYHICGGSILNEKYILTAAHCVYNVDISQYAVVINHDDNQFLASDYKYISEAYVHPDYNSFTAENDIAILELQDDIQESFSKISIASPNEVLYYNELEEFTVVGMGQTNTDNENPESATQLQKGNVAFIDDEECNERLLNDDGDLRVCAEQINNVDSCYGDSGGPLVYKGDDGYRQAGLVSYGLGFTDVCAEDGSMTIYTEVSGFHEFIYDVTGIERDLNGENDTGEQEFINPSSKSGGSFNFFCLFFLGIFTLFRKYKK